MIEDTLYVKKGRRYVPWGHVTVARGHYEDVMLAGAHRLTYCPEDGHRRYTHDVTPDTAAFLAACNIAQYAMEQAIAEKAKAAPSSANTYTPEQAKIIEKFRSDMAEAGALVPDYWVHGTAYEIAMAGVEAVRRFDQGLKEVLENPEKNSDETLRQKLIRCGWVTDWKADTLVACIESYYRERQTESQGLDLRALIDEAFDRCAVEGTFGLEMARNEFHDGAQELLKALGVVNGMTDDFDWDALWDNPETITVSEEDFLRLCAMMDEPPNPATQESLRALFQRKLPWDLPDDEKTV